MRLTWEIIDNLERIGHADLDGIFRRGSEKPVVPSAAVAKALAAARERKPRDDPR